MIKIPDPPIPYLGHIVGNFTDGKTITIEGVVLPPAQRIVINLQTGKNPTHPRQGDDIALHLMGRLLEGVIVRNSQIEGVWGAQEIFGHYPLVVGKKFVISITNERPKYIIKVNDNSIQFKQRLPSSRVNHLSIQGDVKLHSISYETNPSFDRFVPLYDDPPPPYSEFGRQDEFRATHQTGCSASGTSSYTNRSGCRQGSCGINCHCEKCRCSQCLRKFHPPPPRQPQQQQQQESLPWGAIGTGAAVVGVIGAVGGLLYALSKGSKKNDSDDD